MNLTTACCTILGQLSSLVEQLTDNDFAKPVESLGNSTLGQHLRHTLEFFICLHDGSHTGIVNYDKRAHDKLIETDRSIALGTLAKIKDFVTGQSLNPPLALQVGYDKVTDEFVTIESNFLRELVYNIEHAVHHMAIMKIGVREAAPYIQLPADFGVAVSTLRYQQAATVQHQS